MATPQIPTTPRFPAATTAATMVITRSRSVSKLPPSRIVSFENPFQSQQPPQPQALSSSYARSNSNLRPRSQSSLHARPTAAIATRSSSGVAGAVAGSSYPATFDTHRASTTTNLDPEWKDFANYHSKATNQQQRQQQQPSPRSKSAGRVRRREVPLGSANLTNSSNPSDEEDPAAVARAILDLRDKRISHSHGRDHHHHHHHQHLATSSSSSPAKRASKTASTGITAAITSASQHSIRRSSSSGSGSHSQQENQPSTLASQELKSASKQQQNYSLQTSSSDSGMRKASPLRAASMTLTTKLSSTSSSSARRQRPSSSPRSLQRSELDDAALDDDDLANRTLQEAEERIEGLMQELEELRFFQELDDAEPSPTHAGSKPLGNSQSQGSTGQAANAIAATNNKSLPLFPATQPQQHHFLSTSPGPNMHLAAAPVHTNPVGSNSPGHTYHHNYTSSNNINGLKSSSNHNNYGAAKPPPTVPTLAPTGPLQGLKTPRGDVVPAVIRAISPSRDRLPPPPVVPGATTADSSYQHLSPRKISKLDRTTLELETQTLIRKVQILTQEKSTLQSAVDMYEVTLQDHQRSAEQVRQLETELKGVSQQLHQARAAMESAREALLQEYETQLRDNIRQLQRTQQRDLEVARQECEQVRTESRKQASEYAAKQQQLATELRMTRESGQSRETVLELQLTELQQELAAQQQQEAELEAQLNEVTETLDELQQHVGKQDEEMEALRKQLVTSQQALKETKQSKDDSYEVRITSLQHELSVAQDNYQKLVDEKCELMTQLHEQERRLEQAKRKQEEQAARLEEMTRRLDAVHGEYRVKFNELKDAYEAKEKRRLDEMVMSHANENKEYERRLQALQEQLMHATDRHHAEIRQKDVELIAKLDMQRQTLRREIELEHGKRVDTLEEALAALRLQYDDAEADRQRLLQETESVHPAKEKELRQESEYQIMIRDNEIARLKELSDRHKRNLADREQRMEELSTKLAEAESRHMGRVSDLEAAKAAELLDRDEQLAKQKRVLRATETRLRGEVNRKEVAMEEMQVQWESRVTELQQTIDNVREELELRDTRIQELQERANADLLAEQARYETNQAQMRVDIAVLEGKLRASETSLKIKRQAVDDLEERLRCATEQSTWSNQSLQRELDQLRVQSKDAAAAAEQESADHGRHVEKLQDEIRSLRAQVSEFKDSMTKLQKQLSACEDQKMHQSVQISKLHKELTDAKRRIEELVNTDSEKASLLNELEIKEMEALRLSEQYSSTLRELHDKISVERTAKEELKKTLAGLQTDLEFKDRQLSRVPQLQSQLKDMTEGRERLQEVMSSVEAELQRKDGEIVQLKDKIQQVTMQCETQAAEFERDTTTLTSKVESLEKEMADSQASLHDQLVDMKQQALEHGRINSEFKTKLEQAESLATRQKKQLQDISNDFSMQVQQKDEQLTLTKAALEAKLQETEQERQRLATELRAATDRHSQRMVELQSAVDTLTKSNAEIKGKLAAAEATAQEQQKNFSARSSNFAHDLENLTRDKTTLETQLRQLQEEWDEREHYVKQASEKSSNQILELQMKVEELNRSKQFIESKLAAAEEELGKKDDLMSVTSSQYSGDVSELHAKLGQLLAEKQKLQSRLDDLEQSLSKKEKELHEVRTQQERRPPPVPQVDSDSKEKRALRMKIGDVEAELDRKEKQVRDIVDRYSRDIADLQNKLSEQKKMKVTLQREVDSLRCDATSVSDVSSEAGCLKERLASLEKSIEIERAMARDAQKAKQRMEDKLAEAERSKDELEERLKKVNGERSEVIAALEEVINEVQNREEEVESLANILHKRDQELEHAKLIATKALASAQEMKARYKERDAERDNASSARIEELEANTKYLANKTESLQRKAGHLERELRGKQAECSELKGRLRKFNADGHGDEEKSDKGGARRRPLDSNDGFQPLDDSAFHSFGTSPTNSIEMQDSMSTTSAELGNASGWLHDFDSNASMDSFGSASYPGVRTVPGSSESRRSMERDALRKYVRKRYLKSKASV